MTPSRTSKTTRRFAEVRGITSANPKDWPAEVLADYKAFADEQHLLDQKERSIKSYAKAKANGKKAYVSLSERSPEEREKRRETNRVSAAIHRAKAAGGEGDIRASVVSQMRPRDADIMRPGPAKKAKADREGDGKRQPVYLPAFYAKYPEEPVVRHITEMPTEQYNRYKTFCKRFREEQDPSLAEARREKQRKYDEEHREERRAKAQAYRQGENRDRYLTAQRKYKTSEHGKLKARLREQMEHVKEYRRLYKEQNPDKVKIYSVTYRQRHYEKELERVRRFGQSYRTTERSIEWREQYKHTSGYTWNLLKTSARQRDLRLEISRELHDQLGLQPCFYCKEDPRESATRGGIDRIDSSGHYTENNTVPCCTLCNMAKGALDVREFLRLACNIGAHALKDSEWTPNYKFYDERRDFNSSSYTTYIYSARARNIPFELTKEDFQQIVSEPCTYCGREDKPRGCDRVDSAGAYTLDNCVAACPACNRMKLDWEVDYFLLKMVWIYEKCKETKEQG